MKSFETILSPTFLDALGWALMHFLWQGTGGAVLLAITLKLLRGRSPSIRYAAACAALMVILLMPVLTTWDLWSSPASADGITADEALLASAPDRELSASAVRGHLKVTENKAASTNSPQQRVLRQPFTDRLESLLPWLLMAWALGVSALSARLLGGLIYAARLKRRGIRPVTEQWQEMLVRLSRHLRVTKAVRLLESSLVQVPTVLGWLKPVILMPVSALVNLTPPQLEVLLAHELAHIRRHDYLVNLLQTVTETLLFYHPAVWWVSHQIRIEREQACDDIAVSICGGALIYARALTKVERLRNAAPPQPMLAATGGELRVRVRRLVGASPPPRRASSPVIGVALVAALVTIMAGTSLVPSRGKAVVPPITEKTSAQNRFEPALNNAPPRRLVADQSSAVGVASLIARDDVAGEDAIVRRIAVAALAGHAGTVIVMNPQTGRVYTIVNQEWALRREWNPASVFKLVTALAGTGENLLTKYRHGGTSIDLTEALAISSNAYFRKLGERVGSERLIDYARRLGFGEPTGINDANEATGKLPLFSLGVDAGRLGAYGEGVEVTPIQLATITSAIANGGALPVPRTPRTEPENAQFEAHIGRRFDIPREVLAALQPGMVASVERGTGRGAHDPKQTVAGKTGTIADADSSVGLFTSYAPVNDPRLVIVVAVQGKDERGSVAAGIAGTIYRALSRR